MPSYFRFRRSNGSFVGIDYAPLTEAEEADYVLVEATQQQITAHRSGTTYSMPNGVFTTTPPPPRIRYVPKLVIVDRLIAANKIMAALTALNADPIAKARWDAATEILSTDPDVIALLEAIGANPATILAE